MPGNRIANFLYGIAGHAGLFSTVDNIGTYMQLMLNKGRKRLELRVFTE
jgi:CubicO group peptidase (beta-lactamase class C family)